MKIALVTPFYFPIVGGYASFTYNLAKTLTSLGHSVDIITPGIDKKGIQNVEENLRVVFLPKGVLSVRKKILLLKKLNFKNLCFLYTNNTFYTETFQWFLEHIYDVIHTNGFPFDALPSAFQKGTMLIHTFHTEPLKPAKLSSRILYRRFFKFINYTTCVSQHLANAVSSNLDLRVDNIIENGVDTTRFRPISSKRTDNKIIIGSVTQFSWKIKALGLKMLIDSVNDLKNKIPNLDISTIIVGGMGTYRNEIMEYSERAHLKDIVFKISTYEEMPSVYNEFDIYINASGYEGISLSVLEAMACGKPVVTSANFPELDSPLSFKLVKSKEEMVEALRILIIDSEKRKDSGNRALQEAEKRSWKTITDRYINLYRK